MPGASPDVVCQRGQGLPQLYITLHITLAAAAAAAAAAALRRVDAVDAILMCGGGRPRCNLVTTLINPHRKTHARGRLPCLPIADGMHRFLLTCDLRDLL